MSRPADKHGDWVLWPEAYGRSRLYLTPMRASELDAEDRRRREEELAAENAVHEERVRAREDHATTEKARLDEAKGGRASTVGPHRTHVYEVCRHQVLPDAERLLGRIAKLRDGLYGEKEFTAREIKALTTALERGPERSVVRAPDWRDALEGLAGELPAFREAIDVLSHACGLSEATGALPSVPPMLLVGPPGVGKSYFCRRLAETMKCGSKWISMDQPNAGSELRGSDKHWSTARHGALFELLALGHTANPVVVIDELDKAARRHSAQEIDALSQLYSLLEPETSRRVSDASLDIELDASLVTYVATANSLKTLDAALLSRFHVIQVGLPSPAERRECTQRIIVAAMERLGVAAMRVSPGVAVVLENYAPRVILRSIETAVGAAVAAGRHQVNVDDVEVALGVAQRRPAPRMH